MTKSVPDSPPPPEHEPAVIDRQSQLRELTSQSWNLELIISGAALLATLSLVSALDDALAYYRYNLMPDTSYLHDILPTEMLGLLKGGCYILFSAFLINFIMRAFWVGLVGLLAVYPGGIQYDRITSLSEYAQQRLNREMGSLPDYIIRLDRRCNIIFALAFTLVLLLLGVAVSYGLLIILTTIMQWLLPAAVYPSVSYVTTLVLSIGFLLIMIVGFILNLPKFRNHPRFAPLAYRLSQGSSLIFMGLYRPLMYISYTFYSQLPKRVLQRSLAGLIFVFLLVEFIVLFIQLLQTNGNISRLDGRSFMTLRAPSYIADAASFDNLRTDNALIDKASIQADVIREPYLRLFISYPKQLDAELQKRYKEPVWPASLTRQMRREQQAAWYLQVFRKHFRIAIDEASYQPTEFLFTQRSDNGQRGLTTVVLLPENLRAGRHNLKLNVPDSTQKDRTYYQIPFWYVPEK